MRKHTILSAAFIIATSLFISLYAQESVSEQDSEESKVWTLEDCLHYGLKNHPKVIMANHDVKIQEAALLSTKSSFDPKLSAGMNLGNSKDQRRGDVTSFHSNSSQSESLSLSKKLYDSSSMTEEQFKTVITSLRNIAPLDAVAPLISYLEELNDRTEKGSPVASEIALAVINTLGAIGDKAAFDSLLAVTYLNYEESVLTAARDALSGLRWQ